MRKKVILIIFVIVFILGLVVLNYYLNGLDREKQKEVNKVNVQINNTIEQSVRQVKSNNFETEVLNSTKVVLIDFYADWCQPCKKLSPIVEELAKERSDVKFVRINVDNEEKLAEQYKIISIPTLVVIKDGKEINRSIGYIEKSNIEELINVQ